MVSTVFLVAIVFIACSPISSNAQNNIEHGSTGTANLDYFAPEKDAHMQWLIKDIEKHHLDPAKRDIRSGNFQKAKADIEYLLARLVNHPQALMLAGVLARLTKQTALPLAYYKRALKLYPQYAITHAQYGSYLVDSGNIKVGTERLKKAVQISPKLAVAHAWLAKAYFKSGNTEFARQSVGRARELGYKGRIQ